MILSEIKSLIAKASKTCAVKLTKQG